ncbi:MAG TPA: pectinesterase family protein [Phnomibacter sp.]|nr:pectinesterase family protein [Phnomibacter sp.]
MRAILTIITSAITLLGAFTAQAQPPASAITVAQDGSGQFSSIQAAINSVRDLSQQPVIIFIKPGIYTEKLVIPTWKTHITLLGQSPENTIITGADYSGKPYPNGIAHTTGLTSFNTYTSYTVLVQGSHCRLQNLTIQNTAGRVGQAVALHIEGNQVAVYNCHLLGNQDTLYAATAQSLQYYYHCYIQGTTDFIFGEATALFEDCTIKSLSTSYIPAAATSPRQRYGFVFLKCRLIAADTSATRVYLGRPWRPHAQTVFLHCYLGPHIVPEGWHHWPGDAMFPNKEKTCYYAEYQSQGPGANPAGRVAFSHQLNSRQAKNYTPGQVLAGWQPTPATP